MGRQVGAGDEEGQKTCSMGRHGHEQHDTSSPSPLVPTRPRADHAPPPTNAETARPCPSSSRRDPIFRLEPGRSLSLSLSLSLPAQQRQSRKHGAGEGGSDQAWPGPGLQGQPCTLIRNRLLDVELSMGQPGEYTANSSWYTAAESRAFSIVCPCSSFRLRPMV